MSKSPAVAYKGSAFTIYWATDEGGTERGLEFFETLSTSDQAKVLTLFKMLGDTGRIQNTEKFKKLKEGLWEFKSYQVRLLGDFRPGQRFLIALGLKKKKDRHKTKDLEMARQILSLH